MSAKYSASTTSLVWYSNTSFPSELLSLTDSLCLSLSGKQSLLSPGLEIAAVGSMLPFLCAEFSHSTCAISLFTAFLPSVSESG